MADEWAEHTGLLKGLPGNNSYLNGGNGESFLENTHLTNIFKISKSKKSNLSVVFWVHQHCRILEVFFNER